MSPNTKDTKPLEALRNDDFLSIFKTKTAGPEDLDVSGLGGYSSQHLSMSGGEKDALKAITSGMDQRFRSENLDDDILSESGDVLLQKNEINMAKNTLDGTLTQASNSQQQNEVAIELERPPVPLTVLTKIEVAIPGVALTRPENSHDNNKKEENISVNEDDEKNSTTDKVPDQLIWEKELTIDQKKMISPAINSVQHQLSVEKKIEPSSQCAAKTKSDKRKHKDNSRYISRQEDIYDIGEDEQTQRFCSTGGTFKKGHTGGTDAVFTKKQNGKSQNYNIDRIVLSDNRIIRGRNNEILEDVEKDTRSHQNSTHPSGHEVDKLQSYVKLTQETDGEDDVEDVKTPISSQRVNTKILQGKFKIAEGKKTNIPVQAILTNSKENKQREEANTNTTSKKKVEIIEKLAVKESEFI
eukprot:GHVR01124719.1.p1 GENE.GHVR01124719.1~~GHVR01124719.1.p1  ORF type:complete len:412 (+),score=89.87 GHVR01124719.1:1660-2895(+)